MKNIYNHEVETAPAPAQPTTKPATTEPATKPGTEKSPWTVPSPSVQPTPKA